MAVTLNNWQESLEYVNRIGLVNPTMPIGWRQQVLMENVKALESSGPYPIEVRYNRKFDTLYVLNNGFKAIKPSHS